MTPEQFIAAIAISAFLVFFIILSISCFVVNSRHDKYLRDLHETANKK